MSKGKRASLLLAAMAALAFWCGTALAATVTCHAEEYCFGTKNADTLNGTDGFDSMYARAGDDALKGFDGVDWLNGQEGDDTLSGGPAGDYLAGDAGNDTLRGGQDTDRYYFGPGWGKDLIIDDAISGTEIRFHDSNHEPPFTAPLLIDLRSGAGAEARNKSGTNTVNWEGDAVVSVVGGYGDDRIRGNAWNNRITGSHGDDTVFGGGGGDYIAVVDSSPGDTVHCGPGEDTVLYDITDLTGLLSDSIDLDDCEHRIANP